MRKLEDWEIEVQRRLVAMLEHEPYGGDKDRPYDGQSWTCAGDRGKYVVAGLTMRDIGDCVRRGIAEASTGLENEQMDQTAAVQASLVQIEHMLGIYPNHTMPDNVWDEIPIIDPSKPPS